jgi:amidohydrolase
MSPEYLQIITELRHCLHRHPELSGRESETIRILEDFLSRNTAFEVEDRNGWFYAILRGKPGADAVGFRADLDALPIEETIPIPYGSEVPGVSHKCGHDGHCAALCGLALELSRRDPEKTIYLVFQPAEEIGAGGKACAEQVRELGIREIYAFHNLGGYPEGTLIYRKGLTQPASEGLSIRFCGRASHASAPEEGKNPAGIIAETVLFAERMLERKWEGMVLATVTGMAAGTGDFGISAGSGSLKLTLRAEQEEEMKALEREIVAFARNRAGEKGITTEVQISDYFPETRNRAEALEKALRAAERAGLPALEMQAMWRASEDFGYYLKEIPGAMVYIGNGETWPALHTQEYDFNDRILEKAVDLFVQIADPRERN